MQVTAIYLQGTRTQANLVNKYTYKENEAYLGKTAKTFEERNSPHQMVGALWSHLQEIQKLSPVWHKGKLNFPWHVCSGIKPLHHNRSPHANNQPIMQSLY